MGESEVKAELPCRACGTTVEHRVNTVNRWAAPKAHIDGDRICAASRRVSPEQLADILDDEPEPLCPDCGEAPCHPQCLSGGGL